MKRQQAFIDHGKTFLKGGLHTHTTRSDGRLTPEEDPQIQAAVKALE